MASFVVLESSISKERERDFVLRLLSNFFLVHSQMNGCHFEGLLHLLKGLFFSITLLS